MLFAFGKAIKYTLWTTFGIFCYHFYLIRKSKEPEKAFLAQEAFLDQARRVDAFVMDMKSLLTKPPVEKLLPDRPPLPPGAAYPKTLVINLRGTLIHSEYKVLNSFQFISLIMVVWCGL